MKVPRVIRDLGRDNSQSGSVEEALLSCREVIDAAVERGIYPGNLRPNLRRVCTLAQDEGVPLRELLVRLKMTLDETPSLETLGSEDRDGFRSAVTQYVMVNFESARLSR